MQDTLLHLSIASIAKQDYPLGIICSLSLQRLCTSNFYLDQSWRHACSSSNRLTWSFSSSITCKILQKIFKKQTWLINVRQMRQNRQDSGDSGWDRTYFIYFRPFRRIDFDRSTCACLSGHGTHEHDSTAAVYTNIQALSHNRRSFQEILNLTTDAPSSSPYPVYRNPTSCCSSKCLKLGLFSANAA